MRHAHAVCPEPPPTPPDWRQLSARSGASLCRRRRRRPRGRRRRSGAAAARRPTGSRAGDGPAAARDPRPWKVRAWCAGWELPGRVRSAAPRESPRRGGERAAGSRPRMANTATGAAAGKASLGGVLSIALGERRGMLHRATADDAPPPAAAERPAPPPPPPRAAGGVGAACRRRARAARSGRGAAEGSIGRCRPLAPARPPSPPATTGHRAAPALAAGTPLGSPRAVAGSAGRRAPRPGGGRGGGRRRRRRRRRRLLSDVVDDGDGEPTREQAGGEGRRD